MNNEAKVVLTIIDNASLHTKNIDNTANTLNKFAKAAANLNKQNLDFSKQINQTTQALLNQNAVLKRNIALMGNSGKLFNITNNSQKQYRTLADQNDKIYKMQLNHEEKMRKLKTQNALNNNAAISIPNYNYSSLPKNQRQQEYFNLMQERARLANDEILLRNRLKQNTQIGTMTSNRRVKSRINDTSSPLNRLGATGFDQSLYQTGIGLAATGGVLLSASRKANEMSETRNKLMRALQDDELYTNVDELRKASSSYIDAAYKIGSEYGQDYKEMAELMASTAKQIQSDPRIKDVNLRKQVHLEKVKMLTEFSVIASKQMELNPFEAGNLVGRLYDMSEGQLKYQPKDIQNDINKSQRFQQNYIKQTMGFVDLVADKLPNVSEKDLIMSLAKYIKLNPKADPFTFLLESGLMKSQGISNQVAGSAAQKYFTNILKDPGLKKAFESSNSDIMQFTTEYLSPKYQKEVDTYMKGSYAQGLLKQIENDKTLLAEEKDIALQRKKDELRANELMRVSTGITSKDLRIMPGIQQIIAFGMEVSKIMDKVKSSKDVSDIEAKLLGLYNARKGDGAIERFNTSQTIIKTDPNKVFVMYRNAFDKLLETVGRKINESEIAQQGNGLARLSPLNVNNIDSVIKRVENNPAITKLIVGLVEIIAIGLMMGLAKRVGKMAISGGVGGILSPFAGIGTNFQSAYSGFSRSYKMLQENKNPGYLGVTKPHTNIAIASSFGGGLMGVLGALGTLATAASLLAIAFNVVRDAVNASADKRQEGSISGLLKYINSSRPEGKKFTSIQDAFQNMSRNEFDKKVLQVLNTKTDTKDKKELFESIYRQVDSSGAKRMAKASDFMSLERILAEEQALREKDYITLNKLRNEDSLQEPYQRISRMNKFVRPLAMFVEKRENPMFNKNKEDSKLIFNTIQKQLPNATEEEILTIQNQLEQFNYINKNVNKNERQKKLQNIISEFNNGRDTFMKEFGYNKSNIDPNNLTLQANNAAIQQMEKTKDNTEITRQNTEAIYRLNESLKQVSFGNNNQNLPYTPIPDNFQRELNSFIR